MDQLSRKMGKPAPEITKHNLQALQDYHWPGNVRELKNMLEKESTFCLVGEFATHKAMETHFQTGDFEVLVVAASVLGKAFKMMISEILATGGRDLVKSKLASQEKESGLQDYAEHS